ncbi:Rhodanese-related sulfurtransferase [uncultured Gammaproteobacteria bacterium]|jgi:rhodanese-related sulfurtransferase|nr:Rhodanese-related sulfurtransferase [uncultured Gammaproteobacteria bacterium]CAC9559119.1 Rhodanese-related sulfurtransferase [uncultured Gammaproteobacteria bacterium]CAC9575446.1 Rhodanese-related sulfurtransferase [uncultured Gammaproteobacteria bacterium]CAC9579122.1 Rhodanese-related sulfurtransferase [uncultured Gammaproteobacteria bacterium]CAC9596714.1 Rhodanese-related sulfurtransferase [uncultured Gammaproteobacteria bacterium]
MDDYQKLVEQALESVGEVMPWDLEENISDSDLILLDIREQEEFNRMHIPNSIHIPRGLLESACVWNYDDTIPMLAASRNQNIVLICRSGNRSVLAAQTLQKMGFENVRSLKLGIKGWNDNDFEMLDIKGNIINIDQADEWLNRAVTDEKRQPNS